MAKAKMTLGDCLVSLGRYAEAVVLLRETDAHPLGPVATHGYRVLQARSLRGGWSDWSGWSGWSGSVAADGWRADMLRA